MKSEIVSDIFSKDQLERIHNVISNELSSRIHKTYDYPSLEILADKDVKIYQKQGKLDIEMLEFPKDIVDRITEIANLYSNGIKYELVDRAAITYVEYHGKYGRPHLGPHHDGGDHCNFMLDYQLESNTVWHIGVEEQAFELKDNQALVLHPITDIHWRPERSFDKTEYVKMIFFRFAEKGNPKYEIPVNSKEKLDRVFHIFENFYRTDSEHKG